MPNYLNPLRVLIGVGRRAGNAACETHETYEV